MNWYHYVKSKYDEKAKLFHIDINSVNVRIKTDGIYIDITEDDETRLSQFKL